MRSLIIFIFLYSCDDRVMERTPVFEMRCYRRVYNISYKNEVRRKIQAAIGGYNELLTMVKERKLSWFDHISRSSGLAKTILEGKWKCKISRQR